MNQTVESKTFRTARMPRAARHTARRRRFGGSGVMALGVLCLAAGVVVACLGVADLSSRAVPVGSAPASPVTDSSRTPDRLQRIDTVRVGQRVIAGNPQMDAADVEQIAPVDPATWRKITLRMSKPAGGRVDIVLLRPQVWLDFQDAARGETIRLDLAELGAAGPAEVLALEPCPAIEPGPGRVVTGTFAHSAANVVDLRIRGASAPIGTTANHPFWSEDRQAFIPAGQLRPGETLRTRSGVSQVVSITPRAGPERVYNLEVHAEHTYHVALAGVLVHNACATRLRNSMTGAGMYGDAGTVPHHIVQHSGKGADEARRILRKHHIDLDSHWNGVFLPANSKVSAARGVVHHQKGAALTAAWYIDQVNDRLRAADISGGRTRVLAELQSIRRDLLDGSFPGARWNYFGGGTPR